MNYMTVSDIRKLAIHVQCRPRYRYEKMLNNLVTRFPKSIKFW